MYDRIKRKLVGKRRQLGSPCSVSDILKFERQYSIQLAPEIKEFYLQVNGYFNLNDMVDMYSLNAVKKRKETSLNLPEAIMLDNYFVLGDFFLQGSFAFLDIIGSEYKLFILHLGSDRFVEFTGSFDKFLAIVADEPYLLYDI